jgi:hypothetical protein
MNKFSPNALGIAVGVLWATYVFFCGITAMFGWGIALVDAISSLYVGYGPSIIGAIIGAVWGFIDGYVAGVVIAWLYNMLAK